MAQVLLLQIHWLQNSPFGTYVTADTVETFWDTVTEALVVKKNAVVITSGDSIPGFFTYNGQYVNDFNIQNYYQQIICSGADLLQFTRISSFPYISYTRLVNHPTCFVGDVCDLQFDRLPLVTSASSPTATDGQIVVSASGTNGAVKYKLNADFQYSDGTAQVSGTFTGLGPGNYLVFCRDAVNCLQIQSVKVPFARTYNTHYQLEFDSLCVGTTIKAELQEDGYGGSVEEVSGFGPAPLLRTLRGEGEKDKFISILPMVHRLLLTSITEAQYENLYTNDPEKFRLKISIDTGSGYSAMALNKVLAQQYEEAYKSAPYEVGISAICGLSNLDKTPFLDEQGNRLTGTIKQIEVIAFILKKLNLGLSIRSACNLYATGMDATATDDPLDQAYVDLARYYLIKEDPTCREVLQWILEPYGAQIIQWEYVWNIIRVEERINTYAYRLFNENGVYVSNTTRNPVKNVKGATLSGSLHWANQDGRMEIVPGFGTINLLYNLGRKNNLFTNGDFSNRRFSYYSQPVLGAGGVIEGNVPDITGFELINPNNSAHITRTTETIENENVALGLTVDVARPYLLSDTVTLKMGNRDSVRLTYRFKINADPLYAPKYCKAKVQVKYGTYYLQDNGTWTTAQNYILIFRPVEEFYQYKEWNLTFKAPVDTYIDGESFFIKLYVPHIYDAEFTSLATMKTKVTVAQPVGLRTELLLSGTLKYYELKNSTATADDNNVIRPNDYNSSTNPYQWIKVQSVVTDSEQTTTIFIDKILGEFLCDGKVLPETTGYSQSMENNNNLQLNKVIYHGSLVTNGEAVPDYGLKKVDGGIYLTRDFQVVFLSGYSFKLYSYAFSANSAHLVHSGFLRDSNGDGYTTWTRGAVAELKAIEQIFMDMYSAQYNAPWRRLTGTLYSRDTMLHPLDCIKDFTGGSDRKFYPVGLETDYMGNMHTGEFLQLTDVSDADSNEIAAGFTIGFTLGFRS